MLEFADLVFNSRQTLRCISYFFTNNRLTGKVLVVYIWALLKTGIGL